MRMQPQSLHTQTDMNTAKRTLGQEVRMLEGFIGIGLGANEIRLYVEGIETPVVKYLQEHYGDHYAGYVIHLISTPGFRALSHVA